MKMTNDQITATQRVSVSLDADLVTQASELADQRGIPIPVILDHYVRAGLRDDAVAQAQADYFAGYEPASTDQQPMKSPFNNDLPTFRNDRKTVSNKGRRRVIPAAGPVINGKRAFWCACHCESPSLEGLI